MAELDTLRELAGERTSVLDKLGSHPDNLIAFQRVCLWTEQASAGLIAALDDNERLRAENAQLERQLDSYDRDRALAAEDKAELAALLAHP